MPRCCPPTLPQQATLYPNYSEFSRVRVPEPQNRGWFSPYTGAVCWACTIPAPPAHQGVLQVQLEPLPEVGSSGLETRALAKHVPGVRPRLLDVREPGCRRAQRCGARLAGAPPARRERWRTHPAGAHEAGVPLRGHACGCPVSWTLRLLTIIVLPRAAQLVTGEACSSKVGSVQAGLAAARRLCRRVVPGRQVERIDAEGVSVNQAQAAWWGQPGWQRANPVRHLQALALRQTAAAAGVAALERWLQPLGPGQILTGSRLCSLPGSKWWASNRCSRRGRRTGQLGCMLAL